ncbi:MAG: hypothetical protein HZC54_10165 [Verrucomicrobia bacterium]|nr:hypothetical protein [Verrucomicrobiota bacterium]
MNSTRVLLLTAITFLGISLASAASLETPRGTLTVDERGLSLAPRDSACPAVVGHGGPMWSLRLKNDSREVLASSASGSHPHK